MRSEEFLKSLRGLDLEKPKVPLPNDIKEPETHRTISPPPEGITQALMPVDTHNPTEGQKYYELNYIDISEAHEMEDRKPPDDLTDWQSRGELR